MIIQILLLDIVFSLDSVITAVGMADHLPVMIAAVVIAVGVMMFAAGPISDFVARHPTIKMLALSFLLLIGMSLIAEGLRPPHPQGVHLLRDGVLGLRRDAQSCRSASAATRATDPSSSDLCQGSAISERAAGQLMHGRPTIGDLAVREQWFEWDQRAGHLELLP